jgi:ectoine hydroxylase-related dioxygenase (phytanoyl-CoA dioxygenase family)
MDAQQRAFMGERGYLILQQVLSPEEVAELNGMFDAELSKGPPDEQLLASARSNVYSLNADGSPTRPREVHQEATGGAWATATEDTSRTFHMPHSSRGRTFHNKSHRALIAHPRVMPILEELCQDLHWGHTVPAVPPTQRDRVRLDFDQMHYKPPCEPGVPDGGGGMHGHPNRVHITCVYELSSVGPGDGGFACLPGSHHHKFRMPSHDGWRHRWADGSADHATWCVRSPSTGQPYVTVPLVEPPPAASTEVEWPVDVPIHRLELRAGDALVFTERLTHSTVPWRGGGDRRTLFFKYVQRDMKWSKGGQYDELDPDLTPKERDVLSCPERFANEGMERGQGQPPTVGPESPWAWKEQTRPRL